MILMLGSKAAWAGSVGAFSDLDARMNQIQLSTKVTIAPLPKVLFQPQSGSMIELSRPLFSPESRPAANVLQNSENVFFSPQSVVLRYADAQHFVQLFGKKEFGLLSANGRMSADPEYNTVWFQDTPAAVARIKKLLWQQDQPVPQILIKAKIVNVDTDCLQSLGVIFKAGDVQMIIPTTNMGQEVLLDATLSALEKQGHARVISNPQLMAMNRKVAVIESGEEIPYQQSAYNGGTTISFKKAVLRLQVVPEILPNARILLHLAINQDQVSALNVNGVPAINTQQITTQVIMKNHATLVLGGIFEQTQSLQREGVPGLKSLPVVGGLFRYQENIHHHKQLLIFVTPIIVSS